MCGQAGLAGSLTGTSETVFQKLLIYNSTRGVDSTGAASIKRTLEFNTQKPEIVVAKETGNVFNLLDNRRYLEKDFEDVLAGQHRALLGHCRASTRGASSRRNAHPFHVGDVVGTHNGTLSYVSQKRLSGGHKLETDSEAIFSEIAQTSLRETIAKLGETEDAYALVWYDGRDGSNGSINFIRNDKRPLYFAYSKDGKQLIWSSEFYHLAAGMSQIEHEDKYIHELPTDQHYSWEIPMVGQAFGKAKVVNREPPKRPLVTTVYPTTSWKNHGGSNGQSSLLDSWKDSELGLFKRLNKKTNEFEYSETAYGTFYPTIKACWDSMTEFRRESLIAQNKVPLAIRREVLHERARAKGKVDIDPNEDTGEKPQRATLYLTAKGNVMNKKFLEFTKDETDQVPVYSEDSRKVFWNISKKVFVSYNFKGFKPGEGWFREEMKTCPDFVPFTKLDVNARHDYIHKKKGKKRNKIKVILRKGFDGDELTQHEFENLASCGCIECSRIPDFDHQVAFINKTDFLCEFCMKDLDRYNTYKQASM